MNQLYDIKYDKMESRKLDLKKKEKKTSYGVTQWAAVSPHSLLMIAAPHAWLLFTLYDNYCKQSFY